MNKLAIIKKVSKLCDFYNAGKIKTLPKHEVNPGLKKSSRENYLYFTLPPCINFQRSSPAMWQSALNTWDDLKTNYLFFPEKVVLHSKQTIKTDLAKYNFALQRNKHTEIWLKICQTLNNHFHNSPKEILKVSNFDVGRTLKFIQKDKKEWFPYLSGSKLANYWLYILSKYTDVKFKNINQISIIPDTHIIQSSIRLGITDEKSSPESVATAWSNLLEGTNINPIDMHPVLWNWSRNGFVPKV